MQLLFQAGARWPSQGLVDGSTPSQDDDDDDEKRGLGLHSMELHSTYSWWKCESLPVLVIAHRAASLRPAATWAKDRGGSGEGDTKQAASQ